MGVAAATVMAATTVAGPASPSEAKTVPVWCDPPSYSYSNGPWRDVANVLLYGFTNNNGHYEGRSIEQQKAHTRIMSVHCYDTPRDVYPARLVYTQKWRASGSEVRTRECHWSFVTLRIPQSFTNCSAWRGAGLVNYEPGEYLGKFYD